MIQGLKSHQHLAEEQMRRCTATRAIYWGTKFQEGCSRFGGKGSEDI